MFAKKHWASSKMKKNIHCVPWRVFGKQTDKRIDKKDNTPKQASVKKVFYIQKCTSLKTYTFISTT